MIELKVTVDAPELSAAINHLADAIESKGTDAPAAPAKNSRSKKAAAKTAPDAPAVSAPAPSEPVTLPTLVEQPPVTTQPVQTPVITPAQQPAPAAPVAAPMMPQPVATATPVMTPPAAPVTQQFIPQPAAAPTPAPVAPAQPQQSNITLNCLIDGINSFGFDVPEFAQDALGTTHVGFNFERIAAPQIPYLAQGAVIPANHEFLAVLGDQTNGTNIEAPLATIQQALAEVMEAYTGQQDITIRFAGDLAQLARVLKPYIDKEENRRGVKLVTGGVY